MQFSVLDVNNTGRLIAAIQSTNIATESGSAIVGAKQWKGFMELYLTPDRQYYISNNPIQTACDLSGSTKHVYLFIFRNGYSYNVPSSLLICR